MQSCGKIGEKYIWSPAGRWYGGENGIWSTSMKNPGTLHFEQIVGQHPFFLFLFWKIHWEPCRKVVWWWKWNLIYIYVKSGDLALWANCRATHLGGALQSTRGSLETFLRQKQQLLKLKFVSTVTYEAKRSQFKVLANVSLLDRRVQENNCTQGPISWMWHFFGLHFQSNSELDKAAAWTVKKEQLDT